MKGKKKNDEILGWNGEELSVWDSEMEFVHPCDLAPKPKVKITLPALAKIHALMQKFPNMEWAADLLGRKEGNTYIIEDIYIFKQKVTSISVERKEPPYKGSIGVVHSHHSMSAHFSGTDEDYANMNHSISGVVSFAKTKDLLGLEIKFNARVKLPCGRFTFVENVPVEIEFPEVEINTDKIEKEIPKQTFAPPIQYHSYLSGIRRFVPPFWEKDDKRR